MKFGFVILHYLTAEDTIACVHSLLEKNANEQFAIVIVDNNSCNGSMEIVEEKLHAIPNIHFIRNKKNLGFARGNNVGYTYCKKQLDCDVITVMNNDVLFESDNFFNIIKEDINNSYALVGPDIESLVDGGHQNPSGTSTFSRKTTIFNIIKYSLLLFLNQIHLYEVLAPKAKKQNKVNLLANTAKQNMKLHGAFITFTPLWCAKMDFAFSDETFMYLEEDILLQICKKNHFTTFYDPRIKILHKEDSSTNALNQKNYLKRKFVFSNLIKSSFVFLRYL